MKTIWKGWYYVRARRVDNNEWKSIDFYGTEIQLIDEAFNRNFIMTEEGDNYFIGGVAVIPETLEYSDSRDGIYKKLQLKENAIKEYKEVQDEE